MPNSDSSPLLPTEPAASSVAQVRVEDLITTAPPTRFSRLHRPPAPDDAENELADLVWARSNAQSIRDGEQRNARMLQPEPGTTLHLRFLAFGDAQHTCATVARHWIYRGNNVVCPEKTLPPRFGPPGPCPLCAAMLGGQLDSWLKPWLKVQVWAYAVELACNRGDGLVVVDVEAIERPVRLRLELPAKTELYRAAKRDPLIGDVERGTDFELRVLRDNTWHLRALRTGPLQLSAEAHVRRRQLIALERQLGDPRPASVLPALPADLDHALRHVIAHQNWPSRYHRRFWKDLMTGSLPPLEPTALDV